MSKSEIDKSAQKTEVSSATKNFYEKYGEAATQRNIVGRLLKFTKFGEYRAGQEEEEIGRGTVFAAHMPSLAVGYVRWEDNRPAEIVMGPVGEGFQPPPRSELGYTDQTSWDSFDDGQKRDPWQFSNSLILVDLESEELFTFSTSSKGGLGAIGELAKVYGKHIRMKPDEVPVIELDVGSYQHSNPRFGEIRFPIFKVTDWISLAKLPPIDGASSDAEERETLSLPEPVSEPAPKPTTAKPPKARVGF